VSQPRSGAATIPPTPPPVGRAWLADLLGERSVQVALVGWVAANALILAIARGSLPFDRPALVGQSVATQVAGANVALLEVFVLMAVAYALTRHRTAPDVAARAPVPAVARWETLLLLGYAVLGLAGGFVLGRALGWHPISFHVVGSVFGTHAAVGRGEVLGWAAYNFVVYAAAPFLYFRRRYSAERLNLTSTDRGNDALVIVVVLAIEALFQLLFLSDAILRLDPRQLLLGAPLTFGLYFVGTVLPAMILIYAILVPRYLRLTGSVPTTVILGGLTYTLMHCFDGWMVFDSPGNAVLSVCALLLLYFGPGMIKTFLTLRTGNAWVHIFAYHAVAPHTLVDTPLMVRVFGIR
jgi:hypothetical protein